MQSQELQLKQAEEQRKAAKDQADVQEAAERLQIERERIASQERIAMSSLAAKTEKDDEELVIKKVQELIKLEQLNKPSNKE
jgi:hypothetical protein